MYVNEAIITTVSFDSGILGTIAARTEALPVWGWAIGLAIMA